MSCPDLTCPFFCFLRYPILLPSPAVLRARSFFARLPLLCCPSCHPLALFLTFALFPPPLPLSLPLSSPLSLPLSSSLFYLSSLSLSLLSLLSLPLSSVSPLLCLSISTSILYLTPFNYSLFFPCLSSKYMYTNCTNIVEV